MTLWEKAKAELLDIIEWTDDSSDTMVWRFPRFENEIKQGAQLVVRQSQAAVFVNQGEIADVFPPGQHRLTTKNLPILATLMGWKYGFQSPFKAEVYFVNTRNFTNLKWGTSNPVMLRDPEFGPVRLRSYGTYVVRVNDPAKFIREIVGTGGHFTLNDVADQLRNLVVTRFSDMLGESRIPLLDLSASYDELSTSLARKIAPEFLEYGLEVTKLLVENISLPREVEEALDKKSSMGIVGNLDNYVKFQSANAMEAAAKNPGGDASAGVGMGMGFAMANQLGKALATPQEPASAAPQPPPLPGEERYYVGKNGKQAGPFDRTTIIGYITKGAITRETLLWKEGMAEWQAAGQFGDFASLFRTTPPPLPK
ncbi:SPFH domain-containing protein [Geomobilimonas luticola]|uniref:SPFH domain-containing protein n=1 Tax=Geomobilimonas luticola TaxID=1114878 RepID=A0ABS5SEE0_9BACT|nr:SPFH domain-containing protein [Geomobilimonas luticola]MBT0653555.1 SPFH domain-containing protein [Geomobilimonas luticola]